ncbi:MAG TPA: PucR family transcriptional regulator, partial [Cellulomonas sp.]|nr:PucR family transcriptional regulator [Cellulomonas sp.]
MPSPSAPPPATAAGSRQRAAARRPVVPAHGGPETQRRVRDGAGLLAAAAMRRLDEDLDWYRSLPADDRSWVGLVAQAGITAFVNWFADPTRPPHGVGDIFGAAPSELTRSISLQHTLQLVRVVVDVVETHSDRLAAPGEERELREAVLRYSREVAFSAAEVYARAAEVRGAWDARLEALVVDALVRGDVDDAMRSRVAALGWSGRGSTLVMVGTTASTLDEVRASELRRATRRAADDALVGIQGDRLVVFLGG